MCGVLGHFHKKSCLTNEEFRKSLKLIEHRGPDDYGIERHSSSYGELILGHNRLSIIDLSQLGHQPMHSSCGNFCIVYNGEIYNFKEIKEELKKLGVKFTSSSDTEVILAAWIHWKEECLNKFLGMFSFAVFDKVEASIFCAVDQFSIKPFYFLVNGSEFIFSSEIAPILELTDSNAELDVQASYEYLAYGSYDIEERTFIKSIKRIKPGHFMKIKLNDLQSATQVRYWWPSIEKQDISFIDAQDKLKSLFEESIRMHLISDVEVAAALSGGVDSSSIVCSMNLQLNESTFNTFTYASVDDSINEEKWAQIVSESTNTRNHLIRTSSDNLADDLDDLIISLGEPFSSTSTYAQYRVFKKIHENKIKVSLDGQGADEIFAGYQGFPGHRALSYLDHYNLIGAINFIIHWSSGPNRSLAYSLANLFSLFLHPKLKNFFLKVTKKNPHPKWLNLRYLRETGINLHAHQDEWAVQSKSRIKDFKGRRLINKLRFETCKGSLLSLLRHGDRNSMRWSVESRVPFLNKDIVEFIFSLPEEYLISETGETKSILRAAMREVVPQKILDRKDKIGFSTNDKDYLSSLQNNIERYLLIAKKIPFLKYEECVSEFNRSLDSDVDINKNIWRLFNLCRWLELNPKIKITNK